MKTNKKRRTTPTGEADQQRPKQARAEEVAEAEPNNNNNDNEEDDGNGNVIKHQAQPPRQPQPRPHAPVEPPAHGPWGARLRERNHQPHHLQWAALFNGNQQRQPQAVEGRMQKENEEEGEEPEDAQMAEPDIVRILEDVFVGNEVAEVPTVSPGAGLYAMANYVVDNANILPKRAVLRQQREVPLDELEPTFVSLDEAKQRDDHYYGKLLDAFMEDFVEHFGTHFSRPCRQTFDKEQCSRFLHQHFLMCRSPLIQQIVEEFNGRYSTAAWVCFFVENGMGYMMRRYFLHIDHQFWSVISAPLPPESKRRSKNLPDPPDDNPLGQSIREYRSRLQRYRADYQQLFVPGTTTLVHTAEEIRAIAGPQIECMVCAGTFPLSRTVCCSPMNGGDRAASPPLIELTELVGRPGTSETTIKGNTNKNDDDHNFCVECLVGHARAATQEMPLADGGVGLKCMATDCQNALLFSECRFYIPPSVRHQLNARILEENLGKANVANLERCNACNYGVIIEAQPEELRVFSCKKCGAQHCRLCNRVWDDFHVGRRCDEMETAQEQLKHHFENLLSEAIIRKCNRCSLPFVKRDGCNMMVCRCGSTQCYICRTSNIDYVHFCQHFRNPGQTSCRACRRTCLLWDLDRQADQRAIAQVMEEANRRGIVLEEQNDEGIVVDVPAQ